MSRKIPSHVVTEKVNAVQKLVDEGWSRTAACKEIGVARFTYAYREHQFKSHLRVGSYTRKPKPIAKPTNLEAIEQVIRYVKLHDLGEHELEVCEAIRFDMQLPK